MAEIYPKLDELVESLKSDGFADLEMALRLIEKSIYDLKHGYYPKDIDLEKGKEQIISASNEMVELIETNIKQGLSRKSDKLLKSYFVDLKKRIEEII